METSTRPLRGMEIVRKLLEVKEQAQRDFEESLRTDPEVQAVYERLREKNAKRPAK